MAGLCWDASHCRFPRTMKRSAAAIDTAGAQERETQGHCQTERPSLGRAWVAVVCRGGLMCALMALGRFGIWLNLSAHLVEARLAARAGESKRGHLGMSCRGSRSDQHQTSWCGGSPPKNEQYTGNRAHGHCTEDGGIRDIHHNPVVGVMRKVPPARCCNVPDKAQPKAATETT